MTGDGGGYRGADACQFAFHLLHWVWDSVGDPQPRWKPIRSRDHPSIPFKLMEQIWSGLALPARAMEVVGGDEDLMELPICQGGGYDWADWRLC